MDRFVLASKIQRTLYTFIIILVIDVTFSYSLEACQKVKLTNDPSVLTRLNISIPTFSDINYDMDKFDYLYEMMPCTNHTVTITGIPPNVHFIVFQVHSYLYDITLSKTSLKKVGESVKGTNVGLVQLMDKTGTAVFNVENYRIFRVSVLLAVLPYGENAPIPGGCNMEFEVETAPYMKINYSSSIIQVDAQPAKIPTAWVSYFNKPCIPNELNYETYQLYLPLNDQTAESYFDGVRQMLTVDRIKQNGRKVLARSEPELRSRYSVYYGTGSVYAMIVSAKDSNASAYVPISTYTCKAQFKWGSCFETTFFSNMTWALLGVIGIFLCFFGNQQSRYELIAMLSLLIALVMYVLLMNFDYINLEIEEATVIATLLGFILAELYFYIVKNDDAGLLVLSHVIDGIMLGILFASIMFYTPLCDLPVFDDKLQYWMLFTLFVMLVPMALIYRELKLDRLAPAIIGAYCIILSLEFLVHTHLRYIIINPLRMATVEGFESASMLPPYQLSDLYMIALWIVLSAFGIYVQPHKDFIIPEIKPVLNIYPPETLRILQESRYGTFLNRSENNDDVFFSDSDNQDSAKTKKRKI